MIKKIIVSILVCCLISENAAFANVTSSAKPLSQVQAQARADLAALQKNHKLSSKDLFPTLTAAFPFLFVRQKTVADLEAKLQAKEQEVSSLKQQLANAQQNAADQKSLEEQLAEAQQRATTAEEEASSLKRQLANAQQDAAAKRQLENQLTEAQQRATAAEQEASSLKRQLANAQQNAAAQSSLENQLTEAQQRAAAAEKEVSSLKRQLANAQNAKVQKSLEEQLAEAQQRATAAKQEATTLKQQLTKAKKNIQQLEEELVTRPTHDAMNILRKQWERSNKVVSFLSNKLHEKNNPGPMFNLQHMYYNVQTESLKQDVALQNGIIASLREQISVLKKTPLSQLTGLADEKVLTGFFEKVATDFTYQDIVLSASLPATRQYDELVAPLFSALEKGNEKAFTTQAKKILLQTKPEDRGAMSELINTLHTAWRQKRQFDANLVEQVLPSFKDLLRNAKGFKNNFIARCMGKQLLKRAGLLSIFLVAMGTLASYGQNQREDMKIAQRISKNPNLFITANAQELATIEASPLADKAAREIADILHEARNLSAEDMEFFRQKSTPQPTMSIRPVRAR